MGNIIRLCLDNLSAHNLHVHELDSDSRRELNIPVAHCWGMTTHIIMDSEGEIVFKGSRDGAINFACRLEKKGES